MIQNKMMQVSITQHSVEGSDVEQHGGSWHVIVQRRIAWRSALHSTEQICMTARAQCGSLWCYINKKIFALVEFSYQYCFSKKSLKIPIFETFFKIIIYIIVLRQIQMYLVLNPKKRLLSLSYRNTQVDNSAAQTHISVFFWGGGVP